MRRSAVLLVLLTHVCLADSVLPPFFSDNMVLQQERSMPIGGTAAPGDTIVLRYGGRETRGIADSVGGWEIELPPLFAGGPFDIVLQSGTDSQVVRNVMVGEVWFCSGQSNMVMTVDQSAPDPTDGPADFSAIRSYTLPVVADAPPDFRPDGGWVVADSGHVGHVSATAWYFARELHQRLGVAVGIIVGACNGVPAEVFMSPQALADPQFEAIARRADSMRTASARHAPAHTAALATFQKNKDAYVATHGYWPERHTDRGNRGRDSGWTTAGFNHRRWSTIRAPGLWEDAAGLDIDGAVWFRKTLTCGTSQTETDLLLSLGAIDDFDSVWINGVFVGATGADTPQFWAHNRRYRVPAGVVGRGKNTIAIRVFDHFGGGGFAGDPAEMFLAAYDRSSDTLWLHGQWHYRIELALPSLVPPQIPSEMSPVHIPGALYNGMVRPALSYPARGVIWYQGESNAGRSWQYRRLLPALIHDWRLGWGEATLPFGIVQLCTVGERVGTERASEWAELREAQYHVAETVPGCGLVVTIDLDDDGDLHPQNKHAIGKRLAGWALGSVYGHDGHHRSPQLQSVQVSDGVVTLRFAHTGGRLLLEGECLHGFTLAGADSLFYPAVATLSGEEILVRSDAVADPVALRYGWSTNPSGCIIRGKNGLPASPLRTDRWPLTTLLRH